MGKTKGGGPGSGRVTQSWEKRKFVSKNKVRQLSCRYCKKPIAAQNYSRHLQTAHKDEWDANPGDLREFGDRAISFFNPGRSGGGPQSKTAGAAGGGGGVAGEGEAVGGGEAIGEGGGGAAGGVEDGSVDDDLPDANGKHSEMLRKVEALEEIEFKEKNRNKKIGKTLGRCIYKGLYTGSSQSHYPEDVAMLAKEGVDVGEMNHSREYAAKFGECLGEVVQTRVIEYLSSPLPQTGLRPPCKVVADKATHKHWSNNLTGVLTIVPGADHLIQGIFLDAPRCERSTGDALSEDIRKTLSKFDVSPCQVTGLAADGAYTHCSVGKKLDEKLGISGFLCYLIFKEENKLS